MSRSLPLLLGLAALLAAPRLRADPLSPQTDMVGTDLNPAATQARPRENPEAVREAIDDTEVLFDGLARETVHQKRSIFSRLAYSLSRDYKLPEAAGRAKRCMELSEEIVQIEDGIDQLKSEEDQADALGRRRLEVRRLGLKSDLMGAVAELRKELRSLHGDLKGEKLRDFRNWIMVSQGELRRRRLAAEAVAAKTATAEPTPLSAAVDPPPGLAPTATPPPSRRRHHSRRRRRR